MPEPIALPHRLVGPADAPLVIALGGISAGRNVTALPDGTPGWWDEFVGPGRPVDTGTFRVLGVDWADQPAPISTAQQADAIADLLTHLGVDRAHALIGSSYGGMVGLAFGERHPERLGALVCISGAHESHPMATALRALQRQAVDLGLATGRPDDGMMLARGLAMTTYRTVEEFAERFSNEPVEGDGGPRFPVQDYLEAQGRKFLSRFTPERFLSLSWSLDLHRVDPTAIRVPTVLVAVAEDLLVPLWQMEDLRDRLGGPATLEVVHSAYGHDAFLKETGSIGAVIRRALARPLARPARPR
ncbi:MAG TPA: homoserine O-succinyltransferase [Gemmatimonadales bacterium]|nr:homoserine O-succinyltransferase [Gemmatimonadales bacterium]